MDGPPPDFGIPHLTVTGTLGRGGFGVVHRAHDVRLDRPVALKVLPPIADAADRAQFDAECRAHGPLSDHPNIVTIHDAGITPGGRPYLVMELVEGGTVGDRLAAEGPLPWREAVALMIPICAAVQAAHERGIIHRDIKPSNVLLGADGPKLTDFGIACLTTATSPQFAVSWAHAAPESQHNTRDERSDVYSLASTMFELIVGRAPFSGEETSLAPMMLRLISEPAPRIPTNLAPPAIDDIIQGGLAKDPLARPQSPDALATALASAVGSADRSTAGTTRVASPPLVSHPVARPRRFEPATPVERSRSRALPVALLALAVVGLAAGVMVGADVWSSRGMAVASTSAHEPDVVSGETDPTTTSIVAATSSTSSTSPDPEATTSTTTVPETTGPETTVPDTTDPDTTVAPTTAPETTGPETTDPDTTDPEPVELVVPDVVGLSEADAVASLTGTGFTSVATTTETSATVPAGVVIGTNPASGSTVEPATPITVRVSTGPAVVAVPALVGLTRDQAEAALAEVGLSAATSSITVADDSPDLGRVVAQDVAAGTSVEAGSSIGIVVGRRALVIDPGIVTPEITVPGPIQPIGPGLGLTD